MPHQPKTKRAIINADDFGFSSAVTEGILRAHREGIVTSTTIAANMPAAAEAVGRLAEAPDLGVGVHLNVSQGPPLSEAGRVLAGQDGVMGTSAMGVIRMCTLKPWRLGAIEAEFDAQIRWVLDHGIRPTHIDSHRHAHGHPPIFRRVIRLARRYDIPFVRRHREVLAGQNWPVGPTKQRRTRRILNMLGRLQPLMARKQLVARGTWGVEHTGLIDVAWLIQAARCLPTGVTEIMTHPGCPDDLPDGASRLGQSRPKELAALCDPAARQAFDANDIELIHYGHLQRTQRL